MEISAINKQWKAYCEEFETSEYMDIDKHTSMAMKVGVLLRELERLSKETQQDEKIVPVKEPNESEEVLKNQLITLNLWSARRLHRLHSPFAYSELEKILQDIGCSTNENRQEENTYTDENMKLKNQLDELISLNLWSARRLLHKDHRQWAYDELETITGESYERL